MWAGEEICRLEVCCQSRMSKCGFSLWPWAGGQNMEDRRLAVVALERTWRGEWRRGWQKTQTRKTTGWCTGSDCCQMVKWWDRDTQKVRRKWGHWFSFFDKARWCIFIQIVSCRQYTQVLYNWRTWTVSTDGRKWGGEMQNQSCQRQTAWQGWWGNNK